jgi:hypothetical protein
MKDGAKTEGVIGLMRDTADALGRLTVEHLRLAQLEIKADLRTLARQARVFGVLAAMAVIGYGLAMAGLGLLLGGSSGTGLSLLIIGVAHLVAAAVAAAIVRVRMRRVRVMNTSVVEMSQTLDLGTRQPRTDANAQGRGQEQAP